MDEKNQYVSGLTVGPSCFIDDRKHAKRKQRFTLFNAALGMLISNPNEKNKKLVSKDHIINGNKNNNGNDTEGWKKLVGSMRPLHMQAGQSPSPSPSPRHHSARSSSSSTSSRSTMSSYASANSLQELENIGSMSPSVLTNNLKEVEEAMSQSSSPNNLEGLLNTGATMNNLQEGARRMSHNVSASDLGDFGRASSRRKHSASSGNIGELGRKGKMSSSKPTSNLHDLSLRKMRRYKSALNLHDLDMNEEIDADQEDGDDKLLENCVADVMIDIKADRFIKQFYQQMISQHRRNRKRLTQMTS